MIQEAYFRSIANKISDKIVEALYSQDQPQQHVKVSVLLSEMEFEFLLIEANEHAFINWVSLDFATIDCCFPEGFHSAYVEATIDDPQQWIGD